jgi:prefoldin subunit 5
MPKGPQGHSNRQELIAAADQIKRQIEALESSQRYPKAIPKLRAALAEIEDCVAEMESDVA